LFLIVGARYAHHLGNSGYGRGAADRIRSSSGVNLPAIARQMQEMLQMTSTRQLAATLLVPAMTLTPAFARAPIQKQMDQHSRIKP
jgi:hypothetical protein